MNPIPPMNNDAFKQLAKGFDIGELIIDHQDQTIVMKGGQKVLRWNGHRLDVLENWVKGDPGYLKSCQKTLEQYNEFIKLQSRDVSKPSPSHLPTPATPTGQLSTVELKYKTTGGTFRSPDEQAKTLASKLASMGIPKGQDIHIVFATNPFNMNKSHNDQGDLSQTAGGKQAEMLNRLKAHISGTPLAGHVFAAPMPVDGTTADVDTAIAHLDSQLAKGSRVITLENEDCQFPGQCAYGLSQGFPDSRFKPQVIDHIQSRLANLDQKYPAGAAAAAPAPVTSHSSGAAASASSGTPAAPVFPARPGRVAATSGTTGGATAPFDSKKPDFIQVFDGNDQFDQSQTSNAQVILGSLIKSGKLELATLAEIKNIDPTFNTTIMMNALVDYKEGGVVKYILNNKVYFAGIDDLIDNFDHRQKFTCPHTKQDVLEFDKTKHTSAVFLGIMRPPCPNGSLKISFSTQYLEGHKGCGSFELDFTIPDGIQTDAHPNPGKRFSGTRRTCYLPANEEGTKTLAMFLQAWEQRQMFAVGKSVTTGRDNTVTLNDIHPKTSRTGGPTQYGYPDPGYLYRVAEEFKKKEITIDTIKGMKFENKNGSNDDMTIDGIDGEVDKLLKKHTQ